MTDNPNYSYIATVRTPDGGTHYLKDAEARSAVSAAELRIDENAQDIADIKAAIAGGTHFRGITTTALTDGTANRRVVIDGQNYDANTGDFVILNKTVNGVATGVEFIWTGNKWSELGSTGTLKALAFKDVATGSYTPAGNVSKPTATVTPQKATVTHLSATVDADAETLILANSSLQVMTGASVDVSKPTFTGTAATVSVS